MARILCQLNPVHIEHRAPLTILILSFYVELGDDHSSRVV
jgi:hypothetical protein